MVCNPFPLESVLISMVAWKIEFSGSSILELLGLSLKMSCSFYLGLLDYPLWESWATMWELRLQRGCQFGWVTCRHSAWPSQTSSHPSHHVEMWIKPSWAPQINPVHLPAEYHWVSPDNDSRSRKIVYMNPTKSLTYIIVRHNKW